MQINSNRPSSNVAIAGAPMPAPGRTPDPALAKAAVHGDRIAPAARPTPDPKSLCIDTSRDTYSAALGIGVGIAALTPLAVELGAVEAAVGVAGLAGRAVLGSGRALTSAGEQYVAKATAAKAAFKTSDSAGALIGDQAWKATEGIIRGWGVGAGAAGGAWATHKAIDAVEHKAKSR